MTLLQTHFLEMSGKGVSDQENQTRGMNLRWWIHPKMGFPVYGFRLFRKKTTARKLHYWPEQLTNTSNLKTEASKWPRAIWGVRERVLEWNGSTLNNIRPERVSKHGIVFENGTETLLSFDQPVPLVELQFLLQSSPFLRLFGYANPRVEVEIETRGTFWKEQIRYFNEGPNWFCVEGEGIDSIRLRTEGISYFPDHFLSQFQSILRKPKNALVALLILAAVTSVAMLNWMLGLIFIAGLALPATVICAAGLRYRMSKKRPGAKRRTLLDRMAWTPVAPLHFSGYGYSDWAEKHEDWRPVIQFNNPEQAEGQQAVEDAKTVIEGERDNSLQELVGPVSLEQKDLVLDSSKSEWTFLDTQAMPEEGYDYKIEGIWSDPEGLGIQALPWEKRFHFPLQTEEVLDCGFTDWFESEFRLTAGPGSEWRSGQVHFNDSLNVELPFLCGRLSLYLEGDWTSIQVRDRLGVWHEQRKLAGSVITLKDLKRGILEVRIEGTAILNKMELHPANFSFIITDRKWSENGQTSDQLGKGKYHESVTRSGSGSLIHGKMSQIGNLHFLKLTSRIFPRPQEISEYQHAAGKTDVLLK